MLTEYERKQLLRLTRQLNIEKNKSPQDNEYIAFLEVTIHNLQAKMHTE